MTQSDLAQRAFCSVNTIRKIEAGSLLPSKALAREIARALAVPEAAREQFVHFARTPDATAAENAFTETHSSVPSHTTRDVPTAPRSKSAVPSIRFQPPAPLFSAIGRERDTDVVAGILRLPGVRLVTLTGAPGTGKTRLALQVAAELVADDAPSEFEHGAAFVALAPLSHPSQVATAIAQTLNLREPAENALPAFLHDKRLLLILDNFEHLLAAAPLVAALLTAAPRLKIVATSREPLRVYGEREFPVAPLAIPPLAPLPPWDELENFAAVQLFIERAQAVQADFQLDARNAEAIARLVAGLDGLPLAIEMAAARVKWATPQDLSLQLTRRLDLLRGRERGLEARQRTLRGALDWSYGLLDETERHVLRQLGIFRGGFTADATQAVCQLADLTPLENLVEKSLVKQERAPDGAPRYALLEIIREYAREKLGPGGGAGLSNGAPGASELEACAARHYDYFVKLAEQAEAYTNVQAQIAWGERLEVEHDNLRAALDWALKQPDANLALRLTGALHFFWMDRGHAREAQSWYELALARSDDTCAPLYLAQAYSGAGSMTWLRGSPGKAYALHAQALHYFEQVGDQNGIAFSLHNLTTQLIARGELEQAEVFAQHALTVARHANNRWVTSYALNTLGIIALMQGAYDRAIPYFHESLARARENQDLHQIGYVLHNLGCVESQRGNFERARAFFAESLRAAQESHLHRLVAATLAEQGLLWIRQGQPARAISLCQRGAQLALEFTLLDIFASNLEWLAAARAYTQSCERAAQLWGAAQVLRQEMEHPLSGEYHADYERATSHARAQLGPERFAELIAQGRQLTPPQALEYALQE